MSEVGVEPPAETLIELLGRSNPRQYGDDLELQVDLPDRASEVASVLRIAVVVMAASWFLMVVALLVGRSDDAEILPVDGARCPENVAEGTAAIISRIAARSAGESIAPAPRPAFVPVCEACGALLSSTPSSLSAQATRRSPTKRSFRALLRPARLGPLAS